MKYSQFRTTAEIYSDADDLRREALLRGDKVTAKVMRKLMIRTSQNVFDAGYTMTQFISEIEAYEEETK